MLCILLLPPQKLESKTLRNGLSTKIEMTHEEAQSPNDYAKTKRIISRLLWLNFNHLSRWFSMDSGHFAWTIVWSQRLTIFQRHFKRMKFVRFLNPLRSFLLCCFPNLKVPGWRKHSEFNRLRRLVENFLNKMRDWLFLLSSNNNSSNRQSSSWNQNNSNCVTVSTKTADT